MPLQEIEKLHVSIVMLPSGDFDLKLGARDLGTILREPEIEILPPPANIATITSLRDQVGINVSQGRILIRDYSDVLPGTDRFTGIVTNFVKLLSHSSGVSYHAFGLNYDISFSLQLDEPPAATIARKFINRDTIASAAGLDVVGGGVRFFYLKEDTRCNLYLEPRENKLDASKFYAHINVHFQITDSFPSRGQLESSFRREYDEFIRAVDAILR